MLARMQMSMQLCYFLELFHFLHSPTVDIAYSLQTNVSRLREVKTLLEVICFMVQGWRLSSDPGGSTELRWEGQDTSPESDMSWAWVWVWLLRLALVGHCSLVYEMGVTDPTSVTQLWTVRCLEFEKCGISDPTRLKMVACSYVFKPVVLHLGLINSGLLLVPLQKFLPLLGTGLTAPRRLKQWK